MKANIAVIGTGTIGVQALHQLAVRGTDVTGYETFTPGHTRGSAGGESRLFTSLDVADARYDAVIARARELWLRLNEATEKALLIPSRALILDRAEGPATARYADAAGGRTMRRLEIAEAMRRYPQLTIDPEDVVLVDEQAGVLQPELANHTMAQLASAAGASIRSGVRVRDIIETTRGVDIVTDCGDRTRYDRVIVAAGAWGPLLLPELSDRIVVRRLTSSWFFPGAGYALPPSPFMRILPEYVYGIPAPGGHSVKLGVGFEHHLPVADPDTQDRSVGPGDLDHIVRLVRDYLPGMEDRPYRSDTYYETYTSSRRELLDWSSPERRIFVASGFSGHGFKVAPAIGEYIAERVLDVPPTLKFEEFTRIGGTDSFGADS